MWSVHVHPEGQLYFSREGGLHVVTDACLYQPDTLERVEFWIEYFDKLLSASLVSIRPTMELFVTVEDDDCSYYFVDHAARTQWWLGFNSTEGLGLPWDVATSQSSKYLIYIHLDEPAVNV